MSINLRKRTCGICRDCRWCDYEGMLGNNQKQVCQNLSAPHGRYPKNKLKDCKGFEEITDFNRQRNAKRLSK